MTHIFFILKRFARSLHRGRLDKILAMLFVILIVGTLGITYFEPPISLLDAAWWTIVTITTVGYGDITPATLAQFLQVLQCILGQRKLVQELFELTEHLLEQGQLSCV